MQHEFIFIMRGVSDGPLCLVRAPWNVEWTQPVHTGKQIRYATTIKINEIH